MHQMWEIKTCLELKFIKIIISCDFINWHNFCKPLWVTNVKDQFKLSSYVNNIGKPVLWH